MTIRLGFVGCGNHATQNLYPCLRFADCSLAAACDQQEERRLYAKRHFGAERVYDDFEPMLDSEELDAVIVCGPPDLHEQAALASLKRGLPTLVEKPPASSGNAAKGMREAALVAGKPLMVAFMKRFAQKYALAREISHRPEFGQPRHLLLRYSYNIARTDPHGILYGMGIHAIDLMRFFMGDVAAVSVERDEACNFAANLRFRSGASGSLIMNRTAPGVTERLELTGEGQSVTVDEVANLTHYQAPEKAWTPFPGQHLRPNFPLQTRENDSHFLQGYAGEIIEFVSAVSEKRPPAHSTIDDAIAAMRVLDIMASIESGHQTV